MKTIAAILLLLSLAGCAAVQAKFAEINAKSTPGSYVAPEITKADVDEAAMDMAQFLSAQLPAAKTTLDLQASTNKLHPKLLDQLRIRGFGIVQSKEQFEHQGAIMIRYMVTPLDNGVLVQLRYGRHIATRYLSRSNDGRLSFNNRYAVRESK
jgi:hypothetical protein